MFGKLWNKFQAFPEYNDLINTIEELQRQEQSILAGLTLAFGSNFADYARQYEGSFRAGLLSIQDACNSEVIILRKLFTSIASMPSDLKQLSTFHDEIVRTRKGLDQMKSNLAKADRLASETLKYLDDQRKSHSSVSEKSKAQIQYEEAISNKQVLTEQFNRYKEDVDSQETQYKNTVMQTLIAAFESYSTAQYRAMVELSQCAQAIIEKTSTLEPPDDPSIQELETRLNLLKNEAANFND